MKKIINVLISKLFHQDLPRRENSFFIQKKLLQRLVSSYWDSPLYKNIWLKQDKSLDLTLYTELELKKYLSQYALVEYGSHILPLCDINSGIVSSKSDVCIKTSGTSDANQWGKLIPADWRSFFNEHLWIKRTLSCYLKENKNSNIFFYKSFSLTAPFSRSTGIGYVSGILRQSSILSWYLFFPTHDILQLATWDEKKTKIIDYLVQWKLLLGAFHGVPTRWLDIIEDLILEDKAIAKHVLSACEYVSIGWWPALDYKNQFQLKLRDLWLSQPFYGSNNHNASEWFLGSQSRCFDDLDYHWMCPVIQTNFFLFVECALFDEYKKWLCTYVDMILKSHLLHEVTPEIEYLMLFANDRIPRLYNIKDKVIFKKQKEVSDSLLEYIVTGRYGMASNVFNEHIELPHLIYAFEKLATMWYLLDHHNFVAGMQLVHNSWVFHIIVESSGQYDVEVVSWFFDVVMGEVNDQWASFRLRKKITEINLVLVDVWSVRNNLISLGKMHEQSKIPHLSDNNYEYIIKPLLLM